MYFLVEGGKFLLDVIIGALIFRIWLQWVRADFYNPFTQIVVKITHPIVRPFRRIIPAIRGFDTASFLVAWVLALFNEMLALSFSVPISLVFILIVLIQLLIFAGKLVFFMVIISALLTWIRPRGYGAPNIADQLVLPLLWPIKAILPPFGMMDFSPVVLCFILSLLHSLAYNALMWLWLLILN